LLINKVKRAYILTWSTYNAHKKRDAKEKTWTCTCTHGKTTLVTYLNIGRYILMLRKPSIDPWLIISIHIIINKITHCTSSPFFFRFLFICAYVSFKLSWYILFHDHPVSLILILPIWNRIPRQKKVWLDGKDAYMEFVCKKSDFDETPKQHCKTLLSCGFLRAPIRGFALSYAHGSLAVLVYKGLYPVDRSNSKH